MAAALKWSELPAEWEHDYPDQDRAIPIPVKTPNQSIFSVFGFLKV
jgi:hypothetical protein